MTLGEKMIDFRAKNNISQVRLGLLSGMTAVTIARIENGKKCHPITERKILNVIEKE